VWVRIPQVPFSVIANSSACEASMYVLPRCRTLPSCAQETIMLHCLQHACRTSASHSQTRGGCQRDMAQRARADGLSPQPANCKCAGHILSCELLTDLPSRTLGITLHQPAQLSRQSAKPLTLWSWVPAPRWLICRLGLHVVVCNTCALARSGIVKKRVAGWVGVSGTPEQKPRNAASLGNSRSNTCPEPPMSIGGFESGLLLQMLIDSSPASQASFSCACSCQICMTPVNILHR
jgi:hypothetical protein